MDQGHPLAGVMEFWDRTIEDMEATAEEYREAGWETHELHPGDVTSLPAGPTDEGDFLDDRVGLDVLVPGDEFRELEEVVEGVEFDEYEAYRAEQNETVFLVLAMKSEAAGTAVVFPLYYKLEESEAMLQRVRERGEMRTFVRPLHDERRVVFSQQEPTALLPGDDA